MSPQKILITNFLLWITIKLGFTLDLIGVCISIKRQYAPYSTAKQRLNIKTHRNNKAPVQGLI
jgi:hypothetical protein